MKNNNNNNHNHREYTRVSITDHPIVNVVNDGSIPSSSLPQQIGTVQRTSSSSSTSNNNNNNTSAVLSSTTTTTNELSSTTATNQVPTSNSRTITERISDKVMAAIWVIVASLVFHYSNSAHVYLLIIDTNNETNDTSSTNTTTTTTTTANVVLMQLVMIGLGINTVLFLYLLIYLPYIKGLPNDSSVWEIYCPRIIPCITIIGLFIFIILIRATYPIWGFLAPLIIGIEAIGLLFSTHFIPVGFL